MSNVIARPEHGLTLRPPLGSRLAGLALLVTGLLCSYELGAVWDELSNGHRIYVLMGIALMLGIGVDGIQRVYRFTHRHAARRVMWIWQVRDFDGDVLVTETRARRIQITNQSGMVEMTLPREYRRHMDTIKASLGV